MQEGTDFFVVSWLPPYPPYGPHESFKLQYRRIAPTQGSSDRPSETLDGRSVAEL